MTGLTYYTITVVFCELDCATHHYLSRHSHRALKMFTSSSLHNEIALCPKLFKNRRLFKTCLISPVVCQPTSKERTTYFRLACPPGGRKSHHPGWGPQSYPYPGSHRHLPPCPNPAINTAIQFCHPSQSSTLKQEIFQAVITLLFKITNHLESHTHTKLWISYTKTEKFLCCHSSWEGTSISSKFPATADLTMPFSEAHTHTRFQPHHEIVHNNTSQSL